MNKLQAAERRPVFELTLTGSEWVLSVLIGAYNGAGRASLPLARGNVNSLLPDANAQAMKAAQKWLRAQLADIDAEWA